MDDILQPVEDRALVFIRAHMNDRHAVAAALGLPTAPLTITGQDPIALWLAPDQWLLVYLEGSARELIAQLESRLAGMMCIAADATAAFRCYRLTNSNARRLLPAGSGVDFESVCIGQCVRTRFANIGLIAVRTGDPGWELYVDTSQHVYFETWCRAQQRTVPRVPETQPTARALEE